MVVRLWAVGDRGGHPACCAMLWAMFQSVCLYSPWWRGQVLKWSEVLSSVWSQMHLVYCAGMAIERRAYHR